MRKFQDLPGKVVVSRDKEGRPAILCDPEISTLVIALHRHGLKPVASRGRRGGRPGSISLADGRVLVIAEAPHEALRIEALFCEDGGGVEDE